MFGFMNKSLINSKSSELKKMISVQTEWQAFALILHSVGLIRVRVLGGCGVKGFRSGGSLYASVTIIRHIYGSYV